MNHEGSVKKSQALDFHLNNPYLTTVQQHKHPQTMSNSFNHFHIVCTVTGTILNAADCVLLHPDNLMDTGEEMSDSEIAELAEQEGFPVLDDTNLVEDLRNQLWMDGSDPQWLIDVIKKHRPDLIPNGL